MPVINIVKMFEKEVVHCWKCKKTWHGVVTAIMFDKKQIEIKTNIELDQSF